MKTLKINIDIETTKRNLSINFAIPIENLVVLNRPHRSYIINKTTGRCVYRTNEK